MDTSFYAHPQAALYPRDAVSGYGSSPVGVGGTMSSANANGSAYPAQPPACYYARSAAAPMMFGGQPMSVVDQMGVGVGVGVDGVVLTLTFVS